MPRMLAHVRRFDASGQAEARMGERGVITALRANGEVFAAEAIDLARRRRGPRRARASYFTALLRDLSHEQSPAARRSTR